MPEHKFNANPSKFLTGQTTLAVSDLSQAMIDKMSIHRFRPLCDNKDYAYLNGNGKAYDSVPFPRR